MSTVVLRRATYDYDKLKRHVFEMLDFFCGELIRKKDRVLIKPNLLAPASPDRAIVTNPLVIKASVEYILQKGARPQVSDSPAMGSFDKILKESGIADALRGLDVECRPFKSSVKVDTGEPFKKIEIAEDAIQANMVINLPKLKTHSQMLLTLGVKNLFGCVVGLRKPEWHLRTGVDRVMFARLLLKVYKAVNPSITVLDGILAMEGQGPGKSGTPRQLGLLMASHDAVTVDALVCRMIGIEPDRLLTNKIAGEMGIAPERIDVRGDRTVRVENFRLPEITPLVFGPQRLRGFMRRYLVQRPVCDASLCTLCGECWRYCPAKAISHNKETINFDYDACIRCYCCIEVCPSGALRPVETLPGKIVRKVARVKA